LSLAACVPHQPHHWLHLCMQCCMWPDQCWLLSERGGKCDREGRPRRFLSYGDEGRKVWQDLVWGVLVAFRQLQTGLAAMAPVACVQSRFGLHAQFAGGAGGRV
jgi:hypothetical protein